ncbi:hypothetical protein EDB86DRAFT_2917428 [Lactarius hatsudake]|nr:hypothetical protein EDB86DRAFT_2917428 [Lactarius hatsudake]
MMTVHGRHQQGGLTPQLGSVRLGPRVIHTRQSERHLQDIQIMQHLGATTSSRLGQYTPPHALYSTPEASVQVLYYTRHMRTLDLVSLGSPLRSVSLPLWLLFWYASTFRRPPTSRRHTATSHTRFHSPTCPSRSLQLSTIPYNVLPVVTLARLWARNQLFSVFSVCLASHGLLAHIGHILHQLALSHRSPHFLSLLARRLLRPYSPLPFVAMDCRQHQPLCKTLSSPPQTGRVYPRLVLSLSIKLTSIPRARCFTQSLPAFHHITHTWRAPLSTFGCP